MPPSVLQLLVERERAPAAASAVSARPREPRALIGNLEQYIEGVKHKVDAGQIDLEGNPWVFPANPFRVACEVNKDRDRAGERLIDPTEALSLVLRPAVFAWAPERLLPGLRVMCPFCRAHCSRPRWWRHRVLHGTNSQNVYLTVEYTCYHCESTPRFAATGTTRPSKRKRVQKTFLGDSAEVLALLPSYIASMWKFVNTGRIICEDSVADLVRAMATRTSWAAINETLTELKTTEWMQRVVLRYLQLCDFLKIVPRGVPTTLPTEFRLTEEWIRNLYVSDARGRQDEVTQELVAEKGSDILIIDWTRDAAKRCGGNYLLNVMDGSKILLMSCLTQTAGTNEAKPLIRALARRGVCPRLVYVDDECCGAWKAILQDSWPNVAVRLDGMHAITRLTQTVSSTQHPWHGRFCAALSEAIYTYDMKALARLQKARAREGLGSNLPKHIKKKYVPRIICDPGRIVESIEAAIALHQEAHVQAGPLLTADTHKAWGNLRKHVQAGCLCDAPGIDVNMLGGEVTIGGEAFQTVRILRGASALEGFHVHQKNWLGLLAHHAADAGAALLADGALRWNRRRQGEATPDMTVPSVFAGGLLQTVDCLHRRLTGHSLYPTLAAGAGHSGPSARPAHENLE